MKLSSSGSGPASGTSNNCSRGLSNGNAGTFGKTVCNQRERRRIGVLEGHGLSRELIDKNIVGCCGPGSLGGGIWCRVDIQGVRVVLPIDHIQRLS